MTGRRPRIARSTTAPRTARLRGAGIALCGALLSAAWCSTAFAAGGETSRRAHDLALTVDSRWAGGASGGYYPIRMRLTNTARPRELLFRFVDTGSNDSRLPTVERRLPVGQNATLQFTLSIPLVSYSSTGELRVYEDGRLLEQFSQHVALPDARINASDRPGLLVIHPAPSTIDCSRFEEAVQSVLAATTPLPGGLPVASTSIWPTSPTGALTNDFQVLPPGLLPEAWIDYTALDIVAIPLAAFDKLPPAARNALLQWTEAGGTLLVTEVGEPAAQSKDLSRLLDLGNRPAGSRVWHAAQPLKHQPIQAIVNPAAPAGGIVIPSGIEAKLEAIPPEQQALLDQANKPLWPITGEVFSRVDLLAGRVYAFPSNPFPGAPIDWAWWLNSADWLNTLRWTVRWGNSSREPHPGFTEFLIPGVGAVPVLAFVLLISLFAVIIGPVNYLVVLRRKQLYLLLVTIPAIAFVTSCALFAYAMIADGFGTRSRLLSYTMLDQGTKHAVSINRISLYSGLAPSDGLRFSPDTAILPIWKSDACFEGGTIDWTETQALTAGWLRSRTRTQFETVEHRIERGRLEFASAAKDAPLEASNGLEWAIDTLIVKDEAGRMYAGRDLPAGSSLRLHPIDQADIRALAAGWNEFPLKSPPGADTGPSPFSRRWRVYGYYGYGGGPKVGFSQSLLARAFERLVWPEPEFGKSLSPRSYLATFRANPGIELGIERTLPKAGVHLLYGHY